MKLSKRYGERSFPNHEIPTFVLTFQFLPNIMKKSFRNNTGRSFTGYILGMLFLLFAISPYGCKRSEYDGLKEGKVIYDVTFEGDEINPMIKALLPSEVITYFGNDRTCMVIAMGMNIMETKLISDAENMKYTTLVSAMGKKIAMIMNKQEVEENFLDRVKLKMVHTSEEKIIAGVSCKKVMVTDSTDNTYPVYYTDEISVENPNWSTPFREIDGLLMEYSINISGMTMNLVAKEIQNSKNELSFYEIPEDFEIIEDPEEIKSFFN